MATELIKQLRDLIADVENALTYFNPREHTGELFGSREYTPVSFEMALKMLLIEFSDLIETNFFQHSHIERQNEAVGFMKNISTHMHQRNFNQAAIYVESLKALIYDYTSVMFPGSQYLSTTLDTWLSKMNSIIQNFDGQNQQIQQLFAEFEKHDEALQQIEKTYETKLTEHSEEYKETRKKASALIADVRGALEPATVAGLSAAFTERYNEYKERRWANSLWLVGAFVFVLVAIIIGICSFSEGQLSLSDSFARIAIMSTTIGTAWFCATRYNRYENIMGDYEYKTALAKSMRAFLGQFQGEERTLYLKTVLTRLFQDPLRKRHDAEPPALSFLRRGKRQDDEVGQ